MITMNNGLLKVGGSPVEIALDLTVILETLLRKEPEITLAVLSYLNDVQLDAVKQCDNSKILVIHKLLEDIIKGKEE